MADSPEARAMNYAEQNLGVHTVYSDARKLSEQLRLDNNAVTEWADQRRRINEALADREHVLVNQTRGKHPDDSVAAFDRRMKEVLQEDADMRRLRGEAMDAHMKHERAELQVRETEFQIRIATARMEELGGLLQFYGATKAAGKAAIAG